MRRSQLDNLFMWVEEETSPAQLMIEGVLHDPTAELVMPDGQPVPLALTPIGAVRWQASLANVASGWHQVVVRDGPSAQAGDDARPAFATRWIQVGHATALVKEQPGLLPDEGLLRHLAQSTGGVMDLPDAAFVPPTTWTPRPVSLRGWLLPLGLCLLLLEVALRGRTML